MTLDCRLLRHRRLSHSHCRSTIPGCNSNVVRRIRMTLTWTPVLSSQFFFQRPQESEQCCSRMIYFRSRSGCPQPGSASPNGPRKPEPPGGRNAPQTSLPWIMTLARSQKSSDMTTRQLHYHRYEFRAHPSNSRTITCPDALRSFLGPFDMDVSSLEIDLSSRANAACGTLMSSAAKLRDMNIYVGADHFST